MLSNRGRSRKHSVSRCIRVRAGSKGPGGAEEPREQPERGRLLCPSQGKQLSSQTLHILPSGIQRQPPEGARISVKFNREAMSQTLAQAAAEATHSATGRIMKVPERQKNATKG